MLQKTMSSVHLRQRKNTSPASLRSAAWCSTREMAIAAHVAAAADPRHLSPSSHSGMLAAVTAAARLSVAALAARPVAAIALAETSRGFARSACAKQIQSG
jgi:hypothetical protein